MQSINEELQSTNEELETSREELQSINEELVTVNAELQTKVSELSRWVNHKSCELRMVRKDGEVFWANLAAAIRQDADGVWACRVALNDVTERKLKDEELVRTKKALEQAKQQALNLVEELKKKRDRVKNTHGTGCRRL